MKFWYSEKLGRSLSVRMTRSLKLRHNSEEAPRLADGSHGTQLREDPPSKKQG